MSKGKPNYRKDNNQGVLLNKSKPTMESLISRDIYFYSPVWTQEDAQHDNSTVLLPRDGILNNPKEQSKIYMRDQFLQFY